MLYFHPAKGDNGFPEIHFQLHLIGTRHIDTASQESNITGSEFPYQSLIGPGCAPMTHPERQTAAADAPVSRGEASPMAEVHGYIVDLQRLRHG